MATITACPRNSRRSRPAAPIPSSIRPATRPMSPIAKPPIARNWPSRRPAASSNGLRRQAGLPSGWLDGQSGAVHADDDDLHADSERSRAFQFCGPFLAVNKDPASAGLKVRRRYAFQARKTFACVVDIRAERPAWKEMPPGQGRDDGED